MPRKAVAIVLWFGLIGAAIFVYFTFPRTKEEIPRSENQRPFPSAPGPNGIPVPEPVPAPNTPKPPPAGGPNLRVMAWAGDDDGRALSREMDAFSAKTGWQPILTVSANAAEYRRDLRHAIDAGTPPDVCLVEARDYSGLDPMHDLAPVAAPPGFERRALEAFQAGGSDQRAVPDEFSVTLLFYHPRDFDRTGLGWPGRHWTWDILEAMSRGLASQRLTTAAGAQIYPLELPADFDFWNILCTQAGHAALDHDTWHLADADGRESRMRGLDLIHEFFQELAVTAPPDAEGQPGTYFAQNRASLLIGPSELSATLPPGSYGVTLLPADLCRASLAQVNGWAVMATTPQLDAARSLADFLAAHPVHAGWVSAVRPVDGVDPAADDTDSLCRQALDQSLLPRLEPKTARLAQLLDEQIDLFARNGDPATAENLNAKIESEYLADYAPASERRAAGRKPEVAPKANAPVLRGL
jgi:ABC-type glycerol-3-phosphate transport system substrate-binding protein